MMKKRIPRHFLFSLSIQFAVLLSMSLGLALESYGQSASSFVEFKLLSDGDPATFEHGYAGNAINNVRYISWNLYTVGEQQFAAYYGQNPDDNNDPLNETIIIARRNLGGTDWEFLRTNFTANNINDNHDNINFAIDGDGHMHLSWGMHSDTYHYAVSPNPVTGTNPLSMGNDLGTMTGLENTVTYPQFYNLPGGDLLYSFREGSSGNGDSYLNRFDNATRTWSNVHENISGSNHVTYLQGRNFSPNWNSYLNRMVIDDNGRLHITWTNRYGGDSPANESGYQTNNNMFYGYSDDFGDTWNRIDGTPYILSIVDPTAAGQVDAARIGDIAVAIPEGSSLINQTGMALDHNNFPMFGTWYAPGAANGDHRRQYMLGFWDGSSWQTRQVSNRTIDPPEEKMNESVVRDLGRPAVLVDQDGRVLMVYRDNQDSNGITVAHTKPFAEDPERLEWFTVDLTFDNLGNYEPNYDPVVWETENKLHLLYQQQSGHGNNLLSTEVFVMEWDAQAYFNAAPQPFAYTETFDGPPGDLLDGTMEQSGLTWLANGFATTDGILDGSQEGSAVLPLNPEPDNVYTLTMDVTNATNRWVALGFCHQSPQNRGGDSASDRFAQAADGIAWMLYRDHASNVIQDVQIFAGPNTDNLIADDDFDYFANGSFTRELKVILDTRASGGNFIADFLIDDSSVLTGPPIVSSDFGLTIDDINFVGFSFDDTTTEPVIVDNFYLRDLSSLSLGDVNCDGVVNLLDAAPFVDLISNGDFSDKADMNQDGIVNLLDVAPFVELLQGG